MTSLCPVCNKTYIYATLDIYHVVGRTVLWLRYGSFYRYSLLANGTEVMLSDHRLMNYWPMSC